MLTPNKLVFTFGNFYVCANCDEIDEKNSTVRVCTDGQTDEHSGQMQTSFVIGLCAMLYAMRQTISDVMAVLV